jgi:hypothetical protein
MAKNNPSKRQKSDSSARSVFVYTAGARRSVPKDVVRVKFDPSVVEVANCAFENCCTRLREVVLNNGLQKVGYFAFSNCTSLQDITFPSSITEIGEGAFVNCENLRELVLNNGLQKIGKYAFYNCKSLESIALPSSITEIADSAFFNCQNLRELVLNVGLQKIGEFAFWKCTSLECISLPSSITDVGDCAFVYCENLREVILHEGMGKIGMGAFSNCTSLQGITLPSSITEVGNFAFDNCENLREVILHEGMGKIGRNAFYNCVSLEVFRVPLLSRRLVLLAVNWRELNNKVNELCGVVEWGNARELFVPATAMEHGNNWENIRDILSKIERTVSCYEMKEATTIYELALWKSKLDDAGNITANRRDHRVTVPGPVQNTILEYLLGKRKSRSVN